MKRLRETLHVGRGVGLGIRLAGFLEEAILAQAFWLAFAVFAPALRTPRTAFTPLRAIPATTPELSLTTRGRSIRNGLSEKETNKQYAPLGLNNVV